MLAGASVGLLEQFPKQWLAGIGVTIGIGMSGMDLLTRKRNPQLAEACRGIQLSVFLLTVVVAVLTQWHFRTEPWATGVCLLAMVGFFFWSAIHNDELRWMDAAMVTLAIALPYLGFVDMKGQTLHGNNMVFALGCVSAIWLVIAWRFSNVRVIVESRSTVIWNPWKQKSKTLDDLPNNAFKEFVCIEAANAGKDRPTVRPNMPHTLQTTLGLRPLT